MFRVMLFESVQAEIVGHRVPYDVGMVGRVLRVVVLDDEARTVDAVVMTFTRSEAAGPGEMDFVRV